MAWALLGLTRMPMRHLRRFRDQPLYDITFAATLRAEGFHGFDPKPVLETLEVPRLWLLGGEDQP